MRLLALLSDGFGATGGIARYNRDLIAALAQSPRISEVAVLARFGADAAAVPAKACRLALCPGRVTWSVRALALAAERRFDAVFCDHLHAVPLAAAVAGLRRVPLWAQVHGAEALQPPGAVHRLGLSAAALVTALSRYTRTRLLAWADLAPHRVRVLPCSVEAARTPAPRRDDLVARYGLEGRRIVLTIGRSSAAAHGQGHDRVIAALPGILARVPDAACLIVGSGDDQPRLAQLAEEAGVAERVVFAGQVSDAELGEHFALAHVLAMPSTGEDIGIVHLEAAAMGLAVVAGNADGSVDALADGRIGRLIDPLEVAEVEAAVIEVLEGRHPAPQAAEEARRFAFHRFAAHVDALVASLAR
jgi:phosphatidylinositol alpha-1,6-mannosyltransferase